MPADVPADVVDQLTSGRMPAPLIRTDFSDDDAWDELVRRAGRPYPPEDFRAMLQPVNDERLEGVTASDLAGLRDRVLPVYLADTGAMTGDEWTVLVVDCMRPHRPSFRVALSTLASVENNLTLANMDFDDFATAVDIDGVFRGFAPSASSAGIRPAFGRPIPEQPMTVAGPTSAQVASSGEPVSGVVARVAIGAPDEASARRTLERIRIDAIAELEPHYTLLRAAYPSPPEFEERAAVLTLLLESVSQRDVVTLFRLLYDEPAAGVHRQVELVADGASVDEAAILTVRARLRGVGWPAT